MNDVALKETDRDAIISDYEGCAVFSLGIQHQPAGKTSAPVLPDPGFAIVSIIGIERQLAPGDYLRIDRDTARRIRDKLTGWLDD